jgi:hypothetical protein
MIFLKLLLCTDFGVPLSIYFTCIYKFMHRCIPVVIGVYILFFFFWVYRIVQFHQPSRSGSLDSQVESLSKHDPIHRSFFPLCTVSVPNRGCPRLSIGVRGFPLPAVESHSTLKSPIIDAPFSMR